jgi:hypothetical protein
MKTDEAGRMVEFGEFPELGTKRLVLRRMTLADAEFYLRHFSDPDIVELTALMRLRISPRRGRPPVATPSS